MCVYMCVFARIALVSVCVRRHGILVAWQVLTRWFSRTQQTRGQICKITRRYCVGSLWYYRFNIFFLLTWAKSFHKFVFSLDIQGICFWMVVQKDMMKIRESVNAEWIHCHTLAWMHWLQDGSAWSHVLQCPACQHYVLFRSKVHKDRDTLPTRLRNIEARWINIWSVLVELFPLPSLESSGGGAVKYLREATWTSLYMQSWD